MKNKATRYSEDFKKSIVTLYHEGTSQLLPSKDYGIAPSTIYKLVKLYSTVEVYDDTILTVKQVKELQKCNPLFEEENIILITK